MSSFLLNRINPGTIISFRYTKPGSDSRVRNIIVLNPNYEGNLHGLKVEQLTPTEQEYLQLVFSTLYSTPQDFFEPLITNLEKKKEELQILANQREELLKRGQRVVMQPQQQGLFGSVVDKGKNIMGSIVGKITTFGKTQATPIPSTQLDHNLQKEIANIQNTTQLKKQEFDQYASYIKQQQQIWRQIGEVPRHPYQFYHNFIKPMFGLRLKNIYRKFNVRYISTPRIVRSPSFIRNDER